MSRLVLIICIFCWLGLPAITAIRCYECESVDPLCQDAFEPSSGFEKECPPCRKMCVKKIDHGGRYNLARVSSQKLSLYSLGR